MCRGSGDRQQARKCQGRFCWRAPLKESFGSCWNYHAHSLRSQEWLGQGHLGRVLCSGWTASRREPSWLACSSRRQSCAASGCELGAGGCAYCLLSSAPAHADTALFACRPCDEYLLLANLVPLSLRTLECAACLEWTPYRHLSPLSRLTRLEELLLSPKARLCVPLPWLPALKRFRGNVPDLHFLTSAAATLENLELTGDEQGFHQPPRLAVFTRLCKLHCSFRTYTQLLPPDAPQLLPPTLRSVTMIVYPRDMATKGQPFNCPINIDGPTIAAGADDAAVSFTWRRHSSL